MSNSRRFSESEHKSTTSQPPDICDGADRSTGPTTPTQAELQSTSITDGSGLVELDSFLPIVKMLPSILHEIGPGEVAAHPYCFQGVPLNDELKKLEEFVCKITAFTLTKSSVDGISFGMLLRLSRMQSWLGAFFPALKTLRILDCDDNTLQALNLFLSPSLNSIEVTVGLEWDDGSDDTLDNFLSTVAAMCPKLTHFKHSPLNSSSWMNYGPLNPDYCPYKHIRSLHLEYVTVWEWQDVQALAELDSLEYLSLTTVLTQSYQGRAPTNIDGAKWNILAHCAPDRSSLSEEFRNLKNLHVVGHVEFLRDLLSSVRSNELRDLSIKLLTTSNHPESLEDMKELMPKGKSKRTEPLSDGEVISALRKSRWSFRFLNEDQFFCDLVDKCIEKWKQLISIAIDHGQVSGTPREHFMSTATVRKAIALASLERFEISEWVLDSDIGDIIDVIYRPSRLKILHFPSTASCYKSTQGLPWDTLANLSEALSQLESFRGYLDRRISAIPDYTAQSLATPRPQPNFNLSVLTLGDGPISWDEDEDADYLPRVGLYIFGLFPNLKEIRATEEAGAPPAARSYWEQVKKLVKMCQTSASLVNSSKQ